MIYYKVGKKRQRKRAKKSDDYENNQMDTEEVKKILEPINQDENESREDI